VLIAFFRFKFNLFYFSVSSISEYSTIIYLVIRTYVSVRIAKINVLARSFLICKMISSSLYSEDRILYLIANLLQLLSNFIARISTVFCYMQSRYRLQRSRLLYSLLQLDLVTSDNSGTISCTGSQRVVKKSLPFEIYWVYIVIDTYMRESLQHMCTEINTRDFSQKKA